jgi:hypothetical protein
MAPISYNQGNGAFSLPLEGDWKYDFLNSYREDFYEKQMGNIFFTSGWRGISGGFL